MFGEDRPAAGDLARAVLARARSRIAVELAHEAYRGALWSVLRTELGESVTKVSSFVIALLEDARLSLDDLAWMIEPAREWPKQMVAAGTIARPGELGAAVTREGSRQRLDLRRRHGLTFHLPGGGSLRLHVVDESLEIAGRLGGMGIRTRFGTLRLVIPGALPLSVVQGSIGLPAEALVDLRALIGRGWPVIGLEPSTRSEGWTAIVRAGSVPYTMPWAR